MPARFQDKGRQTRIALVKANHQTRAVPRWLRSCGAIQCGCEGTLGVLNELEREGAFSRYAIGGAMAATFYTEPVLTFDLDIFVRRPLSRTRTANGSTVIDCRYSQALRGRDCAYSEIEDIQLHS